MKTSILLGSVLAACFFFLTAATFAINVPKPMAIDIDDLGWKEGWDLHESGGPYRLGLPRGRMMTLQDYEVIVHISEAVRVRIKSLFIMSEFDRSDICAEYPTTNEHGINWDNSAVVNDRDFAIMDYVIIAFFRYIASPAFQMVPVVSTISIALSHHHCGCHFPC